MSIESQFQPLAKVTGMEILARKSQLNPNPKEQSTLNWNEYNHWFCFRDDNDTYLDKLALRANRSVTHLSCLNKKTLFTIGDGLTTEDQNFADRLTSVNAEFQDFNEILEPFISDFYKFGNAYIIIEQRGDNYFFYPTDALHWRLGRGEVEGKMLHSPDWQEWRSTRTAATKPVAYPIFPNFESVELRNKDNRVLSVFRLTNKVSGYNYYGLPSYRAAAYAIDLEYRADKYNMDEFDNNFAADVIVVIRKHLEDEAKAKAAADQVKKDYTGEGNNGKMLFHIVDPMQEKAIEIHKIDREAEGKFIDLRAHAKDNIIVAHGLTRSLVGVETQGQLGSNQQILTEFNAVMSNTIRPVQKKIIRAINQLFRGTIGLPNEPLTFINKPPISPISLINAGSYYMISEARQEAGLDPDFQPEEIINAVNNVRKSSQ